MIISSELGVRAINSAVLAFCSLELLILLLSFPRSKLKNKSSGIFYAKMLVVAFLMICYSISYWRNDGEVDAFNIVLRALAYVGIYVVYVMYIMYVREHITIADHSKILPEWVVYLSIAFGVIGALLWNLSLFNPSFSELSNHELRFGPKFLAAHSGGIVLVLISVIILMKYRKTLGSRETAMLMSMPVLISVSALLEPLAHGLELRFPALMIELLIVYAHHHLELEAKQEIGQTEGLRQRLSITADRMKPHYLYNVLTTIYYLCETDPSRAQHAIGIFSEYMRSTLEALEKQELVEFTWELHEIRNYLVLEKVRFGDKLNVIYDIEYDDFRLPPLTIQPFIENAVKHGIGGKDEGGTIKIVSRKLSDGGAQVRVIDDGVGFDVESIAGQDYMTEGIANVRERLRLEVGGEVTITSAPGKGTTVMVTIRSKDR